MCHMFLLLLWYWQVCLHLWPLNMREHQRDFTLYKRETFSGMNKWCTDQRLYSTNEKYFFYYSNHFMVNFHLHKGFFFFSVHRLPQMTSLFVWESNNTSQLWTLLNEKHRYMCLFCTALKNGHKIEKLSLMSIPLT